MKALAAAWFLALGAFPLACAAADAPPAQPVLTVITTATGTIANDRMTATLRAEVEQADAAAAAGQVNARVNKAIQHAKDVRGVDVATAGYTTWQVGEKGVTRWRVAQAITVSGSDFARLAALVSRMQAEDGMLLSSVDFSVSANARRAAEDGLIREAVERWQQRARLAAQAFGTSAWRPGHVNIQTSDAGRPPGPMYRAQAMAAAPAPVNVEGGTSDIVVTVSGEAILDGAPPPR